MRPFETLLIGLDLLILLWPLWPSRRAPDWAVRLPLYLPVAALAAGAAHLWLEGYRWQMVPAYGLTIVLFLVSLPRWRRAPAAPRPNSARRAALAVAGGLLLTALVAAAPIVFPVPQLPAPGGPYAIGTVTFDWTDPARVEAYAPTPGGPREIMVQVWYPAQPAADARPAAWLDRPDLTGPAIARYLGLPSFLLDHTALVRTHAFTAAPLAADRPQYPVVLYSHGWSGFRNVNLDEIEALASHGFVVVAVDHTYGALVTVFADGRVALNNPKALPPDDMPDAQAQPIREKLVGTYADDLRFVMDQLGRLNQGELDARFAGRLDLNHLGLFGHSTGGGAVVLACSRDPRCQAALGLDAWVVPVPDAAIQAGLTQPSLFLWSAVWAAERPQNEARFRQLAPNLKGFTQSAVIQGTAHYDFTLMPLLSPLAPALGLKGPLNGARVMQIVEDYLVAFFDQTLKNQPSPLLAGPAAAYPEVDYRRP